MQLSDAIQHFLVDRKAKGMRPETIRGERYTLGLLLADVGNINTVNLRHQHLDLFWSKRPDWAPGTRNRSRYHLNAFLKWCQVRGYVKDQSLVENMRKVPVPERVRLIIPQDEFSTFLGSIAKPRNRAACAIGLYLFLRRSEISLLRWQDVIWDQKRVIVVREKVGTTASLPLCDELASELKRWQLHYSAEIGRPLRGSDYVIPAMKPPIKTGVAGELRTLRVVRDAELLPETRANLQHVIKRELIQADYYRPQEGGHTLRRSGAVALYHRLAAQGHDKAMRIVQWMLGHKSIRTTEVYLKLDLEAKSATDILAGQPMFPVKEDAEVIQLSEVR
jgi:integrase